MIISYDLVEAERKHSEIQDALGNYGISKVNTNFQSVLAIRRLKAVNYDKCQH